MLSEAAWRLGRPGGPTPFLNPGAAPDTIWRCPACGTLTAEEGSSTCDYCLAENANETGDTWQPYVPVAELEAVKRERGRMSAIKLCVRLDGVLYERAVDWGPVVPRVGDRLTLTKGGWSESVRTVWWDVRTRDVMVEVPNCTDTHDEDLAGSLVASGWTGRA